MVEVAPIKTHAIKSVAFISSQAFSVANFRGPLIRLLVNKGITVYALVPDFDQETRSTVQRLGAHPIDVSMSRAGMNPIKDWLDVFRLSWKLRGLQVDGTFAYFIKPAIFGTIGATIAGVPKRFTMIEGAGYVFNEQADLPSSRRLLRYFVILLYRLALRWAYKVFFLNTEDQQLFIENKMVSRSKSVLLNGIGVDLKFFSFRSPNSKQICFLMAARLLKEKGVYDYVNAARRVKKEYPNVRFLLLGSIDVNPDSISPTDLEHWISEGLIECPGHVQDVRQWIEQASVFVLPSYYREGIPRSIQEAMAMGRPIITTNSVGCKETVDEGVNGFKVPIRDPEALAETMVKFIQHPDLVVTMGQNSRLIAEKKFDVEKINAEILFEMGVV